MALDRIRPEADRIHLLTTFTLPYDRTSIHGVRRELMDRQAAALGHPLTPVVVPAGEPATFHGRIRRALHDLAGDGFDTIIYADLFLEAVRERREELVAGTGLSPRWPLWQEDTADLADAFCDAFTATTVAVDAAVLDASFAGRPFDRTFLADLPGDVDPCGEHAEFHTFVRDGPVFAHPVPVRHGETVTRPVADGRYHFHDLRPAGDAP